MGRQLHDITRHNSWTTKQTLEFCKGLDEPTLNATVPGTYGTIIETLRHIIDSESSYLFRLTGDWSEPPWKRGEAVTTDVLIDRAATACCRKLDSRAVARVGMSR